MDGWLLITHTHTHKKSGAGKALPLISLILTPFTASGRGFTHYSQQQSVVYTFSSVCVYSSCNTHTKSHPTVRQALLPKAPQCQQALPKPSPTHTDVHALPLMHSLSANPRARYCVLKSRSLAGDKNPHSPLQKAYNKALLQLQAPAVS